VRLRLRLLALVPLLAIVYAGDESVISIAVLELAGLVLAGVVPLRSCERK
jgi:hypothetical protein